MGKDRTHVRCPAPIIGNKQCIRYEKDDTGFCKDEWPESVHTIDLWHNDQKLPTEWPKSVHTIDLWHNDQKLPTEWPESVHTIDVRDNKRELPDEWPKSVHTNSIHNDSPYLKNLRSDSRLEKMS